jgi:hypothetical protein
MKKTIEKFYCDICGAECEDIKQINYPVIFFTEQTEGTSCNPYISHKNLDVCGICLDQICKVSAVGAQGFNKYEIIKGGKTE